jgi:serine/threonine-protein kinase
VLGNVNVDRRTDIYSLGVTLYRLLSGRYPFLADTLPAIAVLIHRGEYTPVSALCAVPPGFDAVIARAMAKDANHRYASALELEAALAGFDTAVPARASPETRREPAPVTGTTPPFATATGSALSRTLSGRERERRRRIVLGSLAAVIGLGALALLLRTPDPSPAEHSPSSERSVGAPLAHAGAETLPAVTVEPEVLPPARSASVNVADAGGAVIPSSAPAAKRAPRNVAPAPGSSSRPLKPGRLGSEFTRSYE